MERVVKPEILDRLSSDDPKAVRSRRDLKMINALMGNHQWLLGQVRELLKRGPVRIIEIGAGFGELSNAFARAGAEVVSIDLAPAPSKLHEKVTWLQGDVFELLQNQAADVLVANLFLHHFEAEELKQLGELFAQYSHVFFCEPHRINRAHLLGNTLHPFVNDVTKHDMHVSIDAGFVAGELQELLHFNGQWEISETCPWTGGLRFSGIKKEA